MRVPILAFALALLCVPASAQRMTVLGGGGPFVAAGGTCPQGSGFGDGCLSAQSTGSWQVTNFFTGYTGTSYGFRPPWNVAGVDYAIGYAGALTDASTATLPGCATRTGSGGGPFVITVNSAPCTLTHLDFGLHNGMCVISNASSGTVTFDNDRFAWGTNCNPSGGDMLRLNGNANVIVQYSHFQSDHLGTDNTQDIIGVHSTSSNTVTITYSAFLDIGQAGIQLGTSGAGFTLNVSNNYAENIAAAPAHGDWVLPFHTAAAVYNDDYDTIFAGNANLTTDCYITDGNGTAAISGHCRHNVLLGPTNTANGNLVDLDLSAAVNAFDVSNNYMSLEQAFNFFSTVNSGTVTGPITCTGNINMVSGAAATGPLGPATCN